MDQAFDRLDELNAQIEAKEAELRSLYEQREEEWSWLLHGGRIAFVAGKIVRLALPEAIEKGRIEEVGNGA